MKGCVWTGWKGRITPTGNPSPQEACCNCDTEAPKNITLFVHEPWGGCDFLRASGVVMTCPNLLYAPYLANNVTGLI